MAAAFVQDNATWNTNTGNKTTTLTPAVGGLIVIVWGNTLLTGPFTPGSVADDQGGTYVTIVRSTRTGQTSDLNISIREQLVTSAVLHTFTLTAASSDTGGGLNAMEFSGMERVGAAAAAQFGSQTAITDSSVPAPSFPATSDTNNPIVGAIHTNLNSTTNATAPSGFTERRDLGFTNPAAGLETITADSGQSLKTVTWGSINAGVSNFASAIVELNTGPLYDGVITFQDPAVFMERLKDTWHRTRNRIFVPDLWLPTPVGGIVY